MEAQRSAKSFSWQMKGATLQVVHTGLDLLTREQVACWNVKPAGNCLHQLIAGHGKAIHIATAG
jgi:hypothetical protein